MPKIKSSRKSTTVDMTAMTDVAFLLLTFFMLATKFKPDEPVVVDTPSSISEIKLPETDVMLLTIDKDGKVYFAIDGQGIREKIITKMGEKYKVNFTPSELKQFELLPSFGLPISQLKGFLGMKAEDRIGVKQPGIPYDSLNNELGDWIWEARMANNNVRVAVKGDRESNYPAVKQVIKTLQDKKVNRFNFITAMEQQASK